MFLLEAHVRTLLRLNSWKPELKCERAALMIDLDPRTCPLIPDIAATFVQFDPIFRFDNLDACP